jgi:hypothetical protein
MSTKHPTNNDKSGAGADEEIREAIMKGLGGEETPEGVIGKLTRKQRRWLLLCGLRDLKKAQTQREAEERYRASEVGQLNEAYKQRQEAARRARQEAEEAYRRGRSIFQCLWDDPACMYGRGDDCPPLHVYLGRRKEREAFADWCEENGLDLRAWVERAVMVGAANGIDEDYIRSDWHPDGPTAYFHQRQTGVMFDLMRIAVEEDRRQRGGGPTPAEG